MGCLLQQLRPFLSKQLAIQIEQRHVQPRSSLQACGCALVHMDGPPGQQANVHRATELVTALLKYCLWSVTHQATKDQVSALSCSVMQC